VKELAAIYSKVMCRRRLGATAYRGRLRLRRRTPLRSRRLTQLRPRALFCFCLFLFIFLGAFLFFEQLFDF
jgi:hypothetical protein